MRLKDYGFVKVFKSIITDSNIDYWVSSDLNLDELHQLQCAEFAWAIEEYHRGLKQCCGAERA